MGGQNLARIRRAVIRRARNRQVLRAQELIPKICEASRGSKPSTSQSCIANPYLEGSSWTTSRKRRDLSPSSHSCSGVRPGSTKSCSKLDSFSLESSSSREYFGRHFILR